MAKLLYVFQTEDPLEAADIAKRLGVTLTNIIAAPGALATGHNPIPLPSVASAPPAYTPPPAAAPAAPVAPPAAVAPPPPPAAPAAPAAHDAEDQAAIAQGWSLDAHLKPAGQAVVAKYGNDGPNQLKIVLDKYQPGAKISTLAPKFYPQVHAELTALAA